MKLRSIITTAVALCLASSVLAQDKLSVGSNAPGLDIEKWVKGKETTIESGKVYVVEFWATWCGPCRKSIPHLTKLQKEYEDQGLVIIGVSTDQDTKKVEPFVKGQRDQMDYTVAIDRSGGTSRAWMQAAGKSGIPCAFIVDRKGKIAWIGNPHPQANEGFDDTLKQVMTGRFDPKLNKQAEPVLQAARSARKVRNWLLAAKHYDDVVALDAKIFAPVALEKFEMYLIDMDNRERAYDYARNELLGQKLASDAGALQMLAEKIATDSKIDHVKRDMDLALEVAEAARRVAGNNDAKALSVVATVRFHRGEVDQAIELQKQAYFAASPKVKGEYRRTLTTYQEAAQRASASLARPN
jgi:thiol-disulfide isomerase/thioredoxin